MKEWILKLRREVSDKTVYIAAAVATLLFTALFVFASPVDYPNGSDQYWHYNYIDLMLKGSLRSYEIFPSYALDPLWDGEMPGFIHNMPILYIWAGAAKLVGNIYVGAMMVNWLLAVGSALLLFAILKKQCSGLWALCGYILMLFFPLCCWQSVQLMTETTAVFFFVLAMYILQKRSLKRICSAAAVLAVCTNERSNVILLAIFLLVVSCIDMVRTDKAAGLKKEKLIAKLLLVVVVYFGCCKILGDIFGATLDFTLSRSLFDKLAVISTFWRNHNMALHFSVETYEQMGFWPMVVNYLHKLERAIEIQFDFRFKGALQWSLNALYAFAVGVLVCFRINNGKKKGVPIFWCSLWVLVLCALSWLAVSILYQNHYRYSYIYLPIVFFVLVLLCSRIKGKGKQLVNTVMALLLVCSVLFSGVLAYVARTDAIDEYNEISGYDVSVDTLIPTDARVVSFEENDVFTFSLYPRTITRIHDPHLFGYTPEQLETLILGRYEPNAYVIASGDFLEEHAVCADIVNEHFVYLGDASGFNVYILRELADTVPIEAE